MAKWLWVLACAAAFGGCAHRVTTAAPAGQARESDLATVLRECSKAISEKRYADAEERLAALQRTAAPRWAMRMAYLRATGRLYVKDFGAAARIFEEHLATIRAQSQGGAAEGWVHNALTWVHWARGDLQAALRENARVADVAGTPSLEPDARRELLLHHWWDRAYLLLEAEDGRPAAEEARKQYRALARVPEQHDGLAVLDAYFAYRARDGAAAREAAGRVDLTKNDDIQDLYVIALALEAGGDVAGAAALRQRIRASAVEYPMKPIILLRMEMDAANRVP
jgi:hypothetical protein